MNYLWHILVLVGIYSLLAMALNVLTGYAGLVSLCQAAFYGIGAYVATLLMLDGGWGFLPAVLTAICASMGLGAIVGFVSLRLKADFFILATLGLQIIVVAVLYNSTELTRGPLGISGIPAPEVFGLRADTPFRYCVLIGLTAAAAGWCLHRCIESPFGLAMKAMREDELAALSLGKNVLSLRLQALAISSALTALAGALFAGYLRYIDPTSFTVSESIVILAMVIIGGAGSFFGPLLGAALLVLLPEVLRFLQIPDGVSANLREVIYGLLIILVVRVHPTGLAGEYDFQ